MEEKEQVTPQVTKQATEGISLEEYFSQPDIRVKRGELFDIIAGVMKNIDEELAIAFKKMAQSYLVVEIMFKVLMDKGIITQEEVDNAKKGLSEELTEKGVK